MRVPSGWRLAVPALWLCAGCLHPRGIARPIGNDGDRIVITDEMIARSGRATAWEVLRKLVPQLTYGEKKSGQPSKLERRGRASFLLNDAPLVFLDGVRLPDFRSLEQVAASTIESIEILNAIDGTTYYGSNAVSGVIVIRTKTGST
jgi:outer membrane cobalamin receptor